MSDPHSLSSPGEEWTHTDPGAVRINADQLNDAVAYATEHPSAVPSNFTNYEEIFGKTVGPLPDDRGDPSGLALYRSEIITE